jgi:hypothetical protein
MKFAKKIISNLLKNYIKFAGKLYLINLYVIPTLTSVINLTSRRRSAADAFSVPKNKLLQY